ncbi:MAG: biotin transporter BioY [Pseudomonadota bacterium]
MSATSLTQPTMISILWPASSAQPWLRNVILAIAGSLFVAASAQIQVPMWPVPFTGQTFAVLVVGMAYGSRLGAATLALYMIEGAVGLPVFSKFAAGYGVLLGPTGGYIAGFVLAAGLVGYLAERGWDRTFWQTALAMLAGNVVIYLPGLLWLTNFFAGLGPEAIQSNGAQTAFGAALLAGATPFLLGDLIKLILAAICLPLAWHVLSKKRS